MPNCMYLCIMLMSLTASACANSTDDTPSQSTPIAKQDSSTEPGSHQSLPEDWKELTHSEWLDVLGVDTCDAKSEEHEPRLKNWINLGDNTQLLLLTCGLGAYQDAYHVYTVTTTAETIRQVYLEKSGAEHGRQGDDQALIHGSLYTADEGETLELLHLSAATGACGWRASYPVEEVKQGGFVEFNRLFADDDCYNGITVEDWPIISSR